MYAGATDGFGQGASAALGGKVDEYGPAGGSGAEAHAQGVSKKTVKLGQGSVVKEVHSVQYPSGGVSSGTVIDTRYNDEKTVPVVRKKVIHKEKTVVRPHKVKKVNEIICNLYYKVFLCLTEGSNLCPRRARSRI